MPCSTICLYRHILTNPCRQTHKFISCPLHTHTCWGTYTQACDHMTSVCIQSGDNRSPQAMSLRSSWWDRCYERKEHFHLPCEIRVSNLIMTQRHTLHTLRQHLKARNRKRGNVSWNCLFLGDPVFLDTVHFGKHLWRPLTGVMWLPTLCT